MVETGLKKRSLIVAGHATSVALEPGFWTVLEEMASGSELSLPALVARIDHARGEGSLASALRLAALHHARQSARPVDGPSSSD